VKAGTLAEPFPFPMPSSRLMLSELSIENPENQEWAHVRVSLEDEGGGAFLVLKQEDQEVRLDFEEIPLLVKAVEMLRSPIVSSSES